MNDAQLRRRLHFHGYIIQDGNLVYIENDDPDNYRVHRVADAIDSLEDTLDYLERAGWPQRSDWPCPTCGDGRVGELLAVCPFCAIERDASDSVFVNERGIW